MPSTEDKLAQIYSLYHEPMLRLALRILENTPDAEDAVHDAFESIARNLDRLVEATSPKTRGYIMVVTERKAIDLLRAQRRKETAELDEDAVSLDFPDMGERYREILLLRFVYGYSMRETAELMDIPFTTVGKLSQRAKERLYEICRKENIF